MEEGQGERGSDETEEDASEIEELCRLLKERETENARLKKELLIYRKMPAFNRSEMGKDEFLPAAPLIRHEYRIVSPVAVDIGGTLAKVAYIVPVNRTKLPAYVNVEDHYYQKNQLPISVDESLSVDLAQLRTSALALKDKPGVLRFFKLQSENVVDFVDFALAHNLHEGYGEKMKFVHATGGGAYKYSGIVKERLNVDFKQLDEMRCMISALNFLVLETNNEIFTYRDGVQESVNMSKGSVFPYLLLSCGSGVSVLLVYGAGPNDFQRVGGSPLGGATFYGLCRLLTNCDTFEEVLQMSQKGDNANVDLLVQDIYGSHDYSSMGLTGKTVASSFGKAVRLPSKRLNHNSEHSNGSLERKPSGGFSSPQQQPQQPQQPTQQQDTQENSTPSPLPCLHESFGKEDMAKSLLFMISSSIAQLGYLHARHYGVKRVIFSGGLIRDNPILWTSIDWAIHYWASMHCLEMRAHFLHHDGYLGALGALLEGALKEVKKA